MSYVNVCVCKCIENIQEGTHELTVVPGGIKWVWDSGEK